MVNHCNRAQHLPPKGSKDITGANALPRAFMTNQPVVILRSSVCPSVTRGNSTPNSEDSYCSIRSLWVSSLRCLLFTVLSRRQIRLSASYRNKCSAQWVAFLRALSKDRSHPPWFPLLGDSGNTAGAHLTFAAACICTSTAPAGQLHLPASSQKHPNCMSK